MKYVAVIRESAVRGAEFCTGRLRDPESENQWQADRNAEIFIGIFEGDSKSDARKKASEISGAVQGNIRLIPVDGDSGHGN